MLLRRSKRWALFWVLATTTCGELSSSKEPIEIVAISDRVFALATLLASICEHTSSPLRVHVIVSNETDRTTLLRRCPDETELRILPVGVSAEIKLAT